MFMVDMKMKTVYLTFCFSFLVFSLIVLQACNNADNNNMVSEDTYTHPKPSSILNDSMIKDAAARIKNGDLILRTGTDYSSDQVKLMSKTDKTYSHGGIAVIDSGTIYVYHVEPDYHYINDKVRKEKLDSFCNPAHNYGFAIARYTLTESESKEFVRYLDKQYQKKIPFDMGFDLKTDDKMYCSEMIKKGLALSTNHKIIIATDRMNDKSKYKLIKQYFKLKEKDFVNREIIPIDHLFINPNCSVIKRYVFERK